MNKSRATIWVTLAVAWLVFALWQYRSCQRQQALVRESVEQQSRSVMSALVGAIRSHRRLGRFFETQLRGLLDGLVEAHDVLAVGVNNDEGQLILSAGDPGVLSPGERHPPGEYWNSKGFLRVQRFEVTPFDGTTSGREAGSSGQGTGSSGQGMGSSGRGMGSSGRGMGRRFLEAGGDGDRLAGDAFSATLLLDRRRADALLRSANWTHGIATAAGGLVLVGLAVAWQSSVRLIEERGRARLLKAEAGYFQELSQAAAGLAHETRNPLGLVRGWTEELAQEVDVDQRQRRAQAVMEECDRITVRINQFLAFARPCRPCPVDVDLGELADELAVLLQPDLSARRVRLECGFPPGQVIVRADRELLRQALFNLLQNAIQFSPPNDAIGLEWSASGGGRLEICDRGPGVEREDRDSLFTPYFTRRPDGTGLGLAIVRRIAAAHGWQAGFRPRQQGGSAFFLEGLHGRSKDNSRRG